MGRTKGGTTASRWEGGEEGVPDERPEGTDDGKTCQPCSPRGCHRRRVEDGEKPKPLCLK